MYVLYTFCTSNIGITNTSIVRKIVGTWANGGLGLMLADNVGPIMGNRGLMETALLK